MMRAVALLMLAVASCAWCPCAFAQRNEATAAAGACATIVTGLDLHAGGEEFAIAGEPYATYSVTVSWPARARLPGGDPHVLVLVAGPGGSCLLGTDGRWAPLVSAPPGPGDYDVIVACN